MSRGIVVRLLGAPFLLLAVASLTFLLMRAAPGGPFDREKQIPEQILRQLEAQYKLDGPIHEQMGRYLWDVARGDLRLSTQYRNRTVNELIAQTLPVSMALGAAAFAIAMCAGSVLGVCAAAAHNRPPDYALMVLALVGVSLPSFILGPLLMLVFSFWLGWFPVGGWGQLRQLWLPALALSLPYVAYITRLVRVSMLEVLGEDYVRTARAKGVSEARVLFVHAFRNAALPLVSYSGPLAAFILTGSLVVETIFNIPGMGPFFVNSVLNRDVFLTGGVTLVYSALLIVLNLLVDVGYVWLDRRIRLD